MYVQYYLVDHSLKMRRGKTCAQCAHGAIYAERMANSMIRRPPIDDLAAMDYSRAYDQWGDQNMTKIVLKAQPEDLDRAEKEFQLCSVVYDSGKTELPPDTRTVVVLPVMEKGSVPLWIHRLPLL